MFMSSKPHVRSAAASVDIIIAISPNLVTVCLTCFSAQEAGHELTASSSFCSIARDVRSPEGRAGLHVSSLHMFRFQEGDDLPLEDFSLDLDESDVVGVEPSHDSDRSRSPRRQHHVAYII